MSPLSVLVADDESELGMLLSGWLESQGCKVNLAKNGNEALALLRNTVFDLIIFDILMPDGDGIEVLMGLAKAKSTTRTLAISGGGPYLSGADCLKLAKRLGAHGLLLKPFTSAQLTEAIEAVMETEPQV
jgi:CheY-like chemotaxis protein